MFHCCEVVIFCIKSLVVAVVQRNKQMDLAIVCVVAVQFQQQQNVSVWNANVRENKGRMWARVEEHFFGWSQFSRSPLEQDFF